MLDLSRREFLQGLAATAVISAIPAGLRAENLRFRWIRAYDINTDSMILRCDVAAKVDGERMQWCITQPCSEDEVETLAKGMRESLLQRLDAEGARDFVTLDAEPGIAYSSFSELPEF